MSVLIVDDADVIHTGLAQSSEYFLFRLSLHPLSDVLDLFPSGVGLYTDSFARVKFLTCRISVVRFT